MPGPAAPGALHGARAGAVPGDLRLPRFLDGPYGALHAALVWVLAWRAVATAGAALRGALAESLVMTALALAVALLALGPWYAALALRQRLGWSSARAHLAGLAGFLALHLPLWAADRAGVLGDPGFVDRFFLGLGIAAAAVALASHGHTVQAEGRLHLPRRRLLAAAAAGGTALLLLATLLPAAAHTPAFHTGMGSLAAPVVVPGVATSWAILQPLAPGGAAVFARDVPAGAEVAAQLVLLATAGAAGFRPALAIAGPGLPPPAGGPALPVALPAGWGAVAAGGWEGRGYEGFTEVPLREGPRLAVEAPQAGRYVVLVWAPGGEAGEFWLALGGAEAFSWRDVHRFPAAWFEVRGRFWQP